MYTCFASTNKGLEELLINELNKLGATNLKNVHAGAIFQADMRTIMQINLHSRIASRILIQLGFGNYYSENDIYDLAYTIEWHKWFSVNENIKIKTSAIRSPLKSLEFITLKVKDAICDSFTSELDARPNVNKSKPDMQIYNFLTEDTVTIYLDTSGDGLFKRGYRQNKLEAPLKENLAAGIIQLAAWNPTTPFYDPMCGSGTLVIEAISYALNLAPGLNRSFAFEKFKNFDHESWQKLKVQAKEKANHTQKLNIYASDISRNALSNTKDTFRNLGLLKYITFSEGDFLTQIAPHNTGTLITNPPYGVRLSEQDELALAYPKWARHLKNHYAGWNCYFFTADLRMPKLMRLKPGKKTPLYNGALECRLFEFRMVQGSNRSKE